MGEMASLWGYAEHGDMDQLGQKLLYTTLELEELKSEAIEEMRKNKEYVNQLIHLLKSAINERDEARNQLNKLVNTTINSSTKSEIFPAVKPAMANSSITESNSLSETHNYSSPIDAVSSPEFFVHDSIPPLQKSNSFSPPKLDRGSLIIDSIARERVLPQRGFLLKAVLQAGPLLKTLMVAGPLPRWRNPPQMQALQIPPVAIDDVLAQKPALNIGQLGSRQMSSSNSYSIFPTMSDFGSNVNSGTNCLNNGSLLSSAVSSNGCFRLPKRQRFY